MKRIQRLIATFVLTLALAFSAVAGDMPTPGIVEPPPPPSTAVRGDMPCPGVEATSSTSGIDPVTEFTLSLLQSLLSLF